MEQKWSVSTCRYEGDGRDGINKDGKGNYGRRPLRREGGLGT